MIFFNGDVEMKNIEISIYSIVGNNFCVDSSDGEKVFDVIKIVLDEGNTVTLSFLNIDMLTSAFLNTAIGQLYGAFDWDKIKNSLSLKDISEDDKLLLKRVVTTAKAFYKNREKMEKIENDILEKK